MVATLVVMGVELLKFIAMLFLQLHFSYLRGAYKRHQEMWIDSNYQVVMRNQPYKIFFMFCLLTFTFIFTMYLDDKCLQIN